MHAPMSTVLGAAAVPRDQRAAGSKTYFRGRPCVLTVDRPQTTAMLPGCSCGGPHNGGRLSELQRWAHPRRDVAALYTHAMREPPARQRAADWLAVFLSLGLRCRLQAGHRSRRQQGSTASHHQMEMLAAAAVMGQQPCDAAQHVHGKQSQTRHSTSCCLTMQHNRANTNTRLPRRTAHGCLHGRRHAQRSRTPPPACTLRFGWSHTRAHNTLYTGEHKRDKGQ